MTHLKELILGGVYRNEAEKNDLAGLTALKHLGALRHLALVNFGLSDTSVAYLSKLKNLEELDLTDNNITGTGIAYLKDLQDLRYLVVDNLNSSSLAVLKELPHFEHLEVYWYDPAQGEADFTMLKGLTWLGIRGGIKGNTERVILPKNLKRIGMPYETAAKLDLRSCPYLERVRVDLPLSGRYDSATRSYSPLNLAWLASIPELKELSLGYPLSIDLKAIAGLKSLRSLSVSGDCAAVDDEGMKAISKLRQLESLTIPNGPHLTDSGLDMLRNLSDLRCLEIGFCDEVTVNGLASLCKLTRLQFLSLGFSVVVSMPR